MQRIALVFTVLVLAAVLGGLLSRHGGTRTSPLGTLEPRSAPIFAPLVDPLDLARDPAAARSGRRVLRIVDPSGPVAGAALVVRAGDAALWAFTDAQGRATLEGLSPGTSRLAVIAMPHAALEVDITPGAEELEVRLAAAIEPLPLLPEIPRSRLAGRIVAAPEGSFEGYEVLLLPEAAPDDLGGALPRVVTCDAIGRFEFEGLAHARYRVRVLPAWAGGGSWPDLAATASRELDFQGPLDDWPIDLDRGEIDGEVRDDLGRALEGALVWAGELGKESRIWPPVSSGPDGRFRISDLPPGLYRVNCRAGEGGSVIESLAVSAGESAWAALPSFAARKRP